MGTSCGIFELNSYFLSVVVQGLIDHKNSLGAPLCPWLFCFRHYDDKVAEAEQGFWNCPCVPMRERWKINQA
ncbi:hypothetical protein LOK49_LG01G00384 [Camellia lanceoleosa]|uniref:Uncharacterized protein n=1 Tax=Camellia lanceoleosa TaxID=1840588 RepID=A0ACC0IXQ9_9ERIC|nr:hypothetical protein LOK49_LG01G00384 [Camellia lanceoleosa]